MPAESALEVAKIGVSTGEFTKPKNHNFSENSLQNGIAIEFWTRAGKTGVSRRGPKLAPVYTSPLLLHVFLAPETPRTCVTPIAVSNPTSLT